MKLFLIRQTKNRGYDTYSDAVVCADSADEAQGVHPGVSYKGKTYEETIKDDGPDWSVSDWSDDWTQPCNVSVRYLGEADPSVARGVVLASYHAG